MQQTPQQFQGHANQQFQGQSQAYEDEEKVRMTIAR